MEPVAIIGIGCRFPGANGPDAFWKLLRDGVDAITEVPADRWDASAFYDPDPEARGKTNSRWGGFLDQVDQFGAEFFRISPREAAQMDPQQRLLLEVAWEALEDAGQAAESLVGGQTGVFVGVMNNEYRYFSQSNLGLVDGYTGSGNGFSIVANRLSYVFGLQGPSMAVDTACSSSLVAVHLACASLHRGECGLALAGGVNILLSPWMFVCLTRMGLTAPDGRCKAFDARANGIVRGEGVGVVVLKTLSDALADGNPIYAVIRGSAVNHDGRANGLMAPNRWAQEAMLREAYRRAEVSPDQVQYVEAHGTGTSLGDPIEAVALGTVLATGRPAGNLCIIGSIKTNFGHLEAAAGIAGLIKVALSLEHKQIPPSLHFQEPNPYIPFDKLPLRVQQTLSPWPEHPGPALAGVSAFGLGGTNAHIVLEGAPVQELAPVEVERPLHILALSARSENGLRDLANRYEAYLRSHPKTPLADVCFTANTGRTHFDRRLAFIAESTKRLREQLLAFGAGSRTAGLVSRVSEPVSPRIAFLFTGQGAQYAGMGRELYETQPGFRETLHHCAEILRPFLEQPLLSVLYPEPGTRSPLDETAYTQPTLFALEYALARLWMSWGVEPLVMTGHSVGEYVAACIAGVFSLEDGLRLIAERGRLMQALPQDGEMAVIFASEGRVGEALQGHTLEVSIAAINGPENVVISGQRQAVQHVVTKLEAEGVETRQLNVSHSFHSPLMEPMLADFERVAGEVSYSTPQMDLVSNLMGALVTEEIGTAEYWCRHVREPVRFSAGMEVLRREGIELFVEVGPKPVLLGMGRRCLSEDEGVWLPSLRPKRGDWEQLLESLGELYVRGVSIDWPGFERDYVHGRRRVRLPTYPFQRKRYWVERSESPQISVGDWIYEVEWQPQASVGQRLSPDYMPIPEEINTLLLPQLAQLVSQPAIEEYEAALSQLEALSVAYVMSAFQQMGWSFQLDEYFSTTKIAERLGVVSEHRQLLERLLGVLAEENLLRRVDSRWEVTAVPEIQDPQEWMSTLLAQHPAARAELTILERCGSRLAHVLRGECDALQLLFPDGDFTMATQLYRDSPGARVMNTVVQKVVLSVLERLPQGHKVPILEVGAGTGGTTSYILPHLPASRVEYVFSDISPMFVTQAQEKFRDYSFVRYQVLDIEKSPEAQGVDLQRFDLVVAASVLHATRDLRQTLQHVRQLLTPGGMLVLLEGTAPLRWLDLVFGLTEGWWRFADRSLRPSYPLLSAAQWRELLQESGFEQPVTISPDQGDGIWSQHAVIVARATEREPGQARLPLRSWLIFADAQGVGEQFGELLRAKGETCLLVFPGDEYEQVAEWEFKVTPANPVHFRQLLETVRTNHPPLHGVVHLWSLDAVETGSLTREDLETATRKGCGSTLHLAQSLVEIEFSDSPSLWLVTRGAQPVDAGVVAVAQSPLWGLGRVIALEHPELWGGMIDLDPGAADDQAATLFSEVWQPGRKDHGEDHIAFRNGRRYVARLVRSSWPQSEGVRFCSDGTYLITGGLGFLGIRVARWMIRQGARHLVLTGRRGLPDRNCWASLAQDTDTWERVKAVQSLEAMGADVAVFQADVTDPARMSEVLEQINATPPSLRGIVHAAGIAEYQEIKDMELDALESVFAPKTVGTWALHQLTRDMNLDIFVCFSSAGAVWGSRGQGHYGAANHFMDALAHYRRSVGLPALSVNWGLLVSGGMVTEEHRRWLTQIGLEELSLEQGFDALGCLLGTDAVQRTVTKVDWAKFKELYEVRGRRPLLEQIEVETVPLQQPYRTDTIASGTENAKALHPLLGRRLHLPLSQEVRFEAQYSPTSPSYLNDHRVYGTLVVAGASHISVALSAMKEAFDAESCVLSDVFFPQALVLSDRSIRTVQLILSPHGNKDATSFQIVSCQEGESAFEPTSWIVHVSGKVQASPTDSAVTAPVDVEQVQARCAHTLPGEQFYTDLWEAGYHFGTAFRWIETIWQGEREVLCKLRPPHSPGEVSEYQLYPGLIDASWMSLASCREFDLTGLIEGEYVNVPFHITSFKLYARPGNEHLWCYAQMREQGENGRQDPVGDVVLFRETGQLIAEIGGVETRRADRQALLRDLRERSQHSLSLVSKQRATGEFLQQLEAAPVDERLALLTAHLRSQLATVLGLSSPDQVKLRQKLFDLGMDSLMAIDLKRRLESSIGHSFRATLLFDHPTLESLTEYLVNEALSLEFSSGLSVEPKYVQSEESVASAALDSLSESDVIALLDEKLADIESTMDIVEPGSYGK